MRIGILSQWFDPEPGPARLPGALAHSLAERGHEVRVLTGFPNYPDGVVQDGYPIAWRRDEIDRDLVIRRVALYPSHDASAVRRTANYASFGVSAAVVGASVFKGLDAVWVSNSPVTVGLPAWRIARAMRLPVLLHVLDLWPDNIVSSEVVTSRRATALLLSSVHRWNRWMYRTASHVSAISPGIARILESRGVSAGKLSYVPLWADEQTFRPSSDDGFRATMATPPDRVTVLYAGTLGRAQAIDRLVDACNRYPRHEPSIDVWIAGSGVEEEELRRRAEQSRAPNVRVRFLGRVPTAEMRSVMSAADIHFIGLRDDANSTVTLPSKLQATMASAKPILLSVAGDARAIVDEAGAGFTAEPGSSDALTRALVQAARSGRPRLCEMGHASRTAYDRDFSLAAGTTRIERILDGLTSGAPA
ncbi:glycosyltransferase family 4 protein [Mumia zhuanghuii]|uniref:Glycosyltransferase family 4 protein n=2 Tax=Mumia TaxID=1546255 RepID=A0ABW1QGU2_9ACTN|nr:MULTISPECIES: glycosyltransferase family 4 protein [Mumia]KAA1425343.1 glycosyltransferase family 4 protein [Mumia zhuanghuii]